MKRLFAYLLVIPIISTLTFANVRIVASTADLASIAKEIAGPLAEVDHICRGTADPHSVEVLPSYMVKVARADLYLKVGLELDFWADPIIDGSRNARLVVVDCSRGIVPLEVPTEKVDASMGDIHPQGNPHYWLDPNNGIVIAKNILDGLIQVNPSKGEAYQEGFRRFQTELDSKISEWNSAAQALKGKEIVTFHNSWPYFARAFGVKIVGFVEPKPGIEPTPSHTAELIELIKTRSISVIGMEPYFSDKVPKSIAAAASARLVVLPPFTGGAPEIDSYFLLFDYLIRILLNEKGTLNP
jgi:ABC-type Zn uptake system ZnuABC Zn-binding protein ZnuA